MKKNYWRILTSLFLAGTLIMGMSAVSYAEGRGDLTSDETASLAQYDEAFLERQSESAEHYQELQDMLSVSAYSNDSFTENYGGAYIDDNGNLVVYLKDTDSNSINRLREIDTEVIVKPCQYSFNELTGIMNQLNDYKLNGTDEFANEFNYYKLSDSENKIIVELEELTDENIAKFKDKVCDSESITFEQATDDGVEEVDINAGSEITSSSSSASVGYRAKRNGVAGIVTASHFVKSGDIVTANGSTIGSCDASVYSGAVDAAFVKVTNGTPTNTINGMGTTLSTTISEPGVGTVINKRGMKTESTSGKIVSTNASWTINGVTFTNLTSATYNSDSGDSGGIVYSYVSSTGTRLTLGIHKGRKDGNAHYVKANEINRSLGTSRY